ncbi:MAG: sulfatase [Planctomycetota bacterium]|jgi:arylsulfatase A-like enzyme
MKNTTIILLLWALLPALATAKTRPNIVIFLVDDMGWTDCGAYGSQYYETPNTDRLATLSMRFTDAYAHPLCSPSRASILTGQEESRHGIMSAHGHLPPDPPGPQVYQSAASNQRFLLPKSKQFLDPDTISLAEVLRDAGYRTAHMGKWHLGLTKPYRPEAHGFETTFHAAPDPGPPGGTYFSPHNVQPDGNPTGTSPVGNIVDGPPGEHISDRLAEEAIKFITLHKNEPFFLNLWQYSVHGPWEAKEEYIKRFAAKKDPKGRHGNPVMGAMLKSMDDSLGRVLQALDDLNLANNTIFVFFSDNGGNFHSWATEAEQNNYLKNEKHRLHHMVKTYKTYAGLQTPTNNAPLREGKGKLYEGGVRVPLMVRWPGKIPAGSTSDAIINNIDLYPTLLELAGVPLPKRHPVDGLSFAPVLLKGQPFTRDTSFSWFPYHNAGIAVRKGDWKLIRRFKENPRYYEGLVELYNLKDDLGETTNLATKMPDKVAELGQLIDRHFAQTGGLYPKPNPNYEPRSSTPRASTPRGPTVGLVPKLCEITPIDGAIRVQPQGKKPFIGTAQVKLYGTITLRLRARGVNGRGGTGRIQWKNRDQDEFPQTGQSAPFELPTGDGWHDIEVTAPNSGVTQLVRIHLPDGQPLEIQSIRWGAEGKRGASWDFSSLKP